MIKKTFIALFLVVIVITAVVNHSRAQPELHGETLRSTDFTALQAPPAKLSAAAPPQRESTRSTSRDPSLPWGVITFQWLNEGHPDWDIGYYDDNGIHTDWEVNSGLNDIHSHFSRGGAYMAFASNRDGAYDIYRWNAADRSIVQLTHERSDDVWPAWAPDSSTIAFESYRDQQPEIYKMSASGGNVVRLTNHPDFDGMPSWSPDGRHIAFSSRRNGQYRIYIMEQDGNNLRQVSTIPYSFRPHWSPDGQHIVFDADQNNDGWQEIWVVKADGSNQRLLRQPERNTSLIAGGWNADGSYALSTTVIFINYNGAWYWDGTESYAIPLNGDRPDRLYRLSHTTWYPKGQSLDAQAPTTALSALPATSLAAYFALEVTGYDIGGSGLTNVSVAHRPPGTTWQTTTIPYLEEGLPLGLHLDATPGQTIEVMVRGTDHAYNQEPWDTSQVMRTTFYTNRFSGVVHSNVGVPLEGVAPRLIPAALQQTPTDSNGRFSADILRFKNNALQFERAGYGTLSLSNAAPIPAPTYRYYLPPADNLITNGSFQQGSNGLAAWQVNGDVGATVRDNGRVNILTIGQECPSPCLAPTSPLATTSDAFFESHDAFHVDARGTLHTLGVTFPMCAECGQPSTVRYRNYSEATGWSAPREWYMNAGNARWVESQQGFFVLVRSGSRLKGYVLNIEGPPTWSEPIDLGESGDATVHAFGQDGSIHMIFYTSGVPSFAYRRRTADGQIWSRPVAAFDTYYPSDLKMQIDPFGIAHLVWLTDNYPSNRIDAWTLRIYPDGVISQPELLDLPDEAAILEEFLISGSGRFHLVYATHDLVYRHTAKEWDGAWSTPTDLPPLESHSAATVAGITDHENNVHFVFKPEQRGSVGYALWNESTQELSLTTFALSGNVSRWQVDAGSDGRPHVRAMYYGTSYTEIQYFGSPLEEAPRLGSVSQSIHIPDAMAQPVLAFNMRSEGQDSQVNARFAIQIDDGSETVKLYPQRHTTSWHQEWFDLSAWRGKTITLRFALEQALERPRMQVHLDQITLGSAHPDTAVTAHGAPASLLPGQMFTVQITAVNRSSVDAAYGLLRLKLPPAIQFVSADTPPDNTGPLRWKLGTLTAGDPHTVMVTLQVRPDVAPGRTVQLTAEVTSSTAELEMHNNAVVVPLFIGYRSFLPRVTGN